MVLGHKCVLVVCEHNHPTMIKIHPLLISESPLNQVSLTRPGLPFWLSDSGTSHCLGPGHGGWLTALHCYSFHPYRLYAVLHFLRARAAVMSRKQSPSSVFRCKTKHKSLHFLPTSELLRTLCITFIFQCNAPKNLPKYMYHSRVLCECYVLIVFSVSTVFVCVHEVFLTDQCRACEISLHCLKKKKIHVFLLWNVTCDTDDKCDRMWHWWTCIQNVPIVSHAG